jgi:D-threonate/D-erythronate kinase
MIAVIADDLSGAAEAAGAAHRRGLRVEVQTRFFPEAAADADVICIDAATRALPPEEAGGVARRLGAEVAAAAPAWTYLKFDSVLRGNVAVELRAGMSASSHSSALLVPANPSRGRVIRGGEYQVGGIPLHETAFARDPEHPRTSADVRELLGGAILGVTVPDVEDAGGLEALAASTASGTLAAGAAEFFEALLARRVPPPRAAPARGADDVAGNDSGAAPKRRGATIVVCGSLAAWPERRAEAGKRGVRVLEIAADAAGVAAEARRGAFMLLGIGEERRSGDSTSSELVEALARLAAEVVERVTPDRLLLEGGATAAAVVRRMGWTRLRAVHDDEGGGGLVALRPVGRESPSVYIKPGSYSWPEDLW